MYIRSLFNFANLSKLGRYKSKRFIWCFCLIKVYSPHRRRWHFVLLGSHSNLQTSLVYILLLSAPPRRRRRRRRPLLRRGKLLLFPLFSWGAERISEIIDQRGVFNFRLQLYGKKRVIFTLDDGVHFTGPIIFWRSDAIQLN